jgi:16S rRNA (uracil1498-N3)-methyltransferase
MKIHRFIGNFSLDADRFLLRDPEIARQIAVVLKLQSGESVVLCDGKGNEAVCEITNVDRKSVEVAVKNRRPSYVPPRRVILYAAILKKENFEYVVQKAVECGVSEIRPIITSRTIKLGINAERMEKIMKEAAEQCGRGDVPPCFSSASFSAALRQSQTNDVNYFFDAGGAPFGLGIRTGTIGVWVGPEGGWDESEAVIAKEKGFSVASLGNLVLRAETAATVAVYLAAG